MRAREGAVTWRAGRRASRMVIALTAATTLALTLAPAAGAGGFTARLYASGHTPRVGPWPIRVTAYRDGRGLSGTVSYVYLYQGQVVSRQPGGSFHGGVWRDTMRWPSAAVGHRITLRVVVRTRYGTDYLDWWIQVRR